MLSKAQLAFGAVGAAMGLPPCPVPDERSRDGFVYAEDLDTLIFCAVHQLDRGGPPYTTIRPPEWLVVPVPPHLEPAVVALQAINGEHVRELGMDVPDNGDLEKAAVYILATLHFVAMEDAVRETLHELLAECRL